MPAPLADLKAAGAAEHSSQSEYYILFSCRRSHLKKTFRSLKVLPRPPSRWGGGSLPRPKYPISVHSLSCLELLPFGPRSPTLCSPPPKKKNLSTTDLVES